MPTYYITKYALSSEGRPAVIESDAVPDKDGQILLKFPENAPWSSSFKMGSTVFESKSEAISTIGADQDKKIAGLERQIAKLRKIRL